MADKKTKKTETDLKKGSGIKDLAPARDPKGGELKTSLRGDLPRGGWDGNHNLASA